MHTHDRVYLPGVIAAGVMIALACGVAQAEPESDGQEPDEAAAMPSLIPTLPEYGGDL